MCKQTVEIDGPGDTTLRFMIDNPITICEIVSPILDENGEETEVEDIWSYGISVKKDGDVFKRSIGIEKAAKSAIEKFEKVYRREYWEPVLKLIREERERELEEIRILAEKEAQKLRSKQALMPKRRALQLHQISKEPATYTFSVTL